MADDVTPAQENADSGVLDHHIVDDLTAYREVVKLVRSITDAALREVGGQIEWRGGYYVVVAPPGQAQRAFGIALQAAGVPFHMGTSEEYHDWLHREYMSQPGAHLTQVLVAR